MPTYDYKCKKCNKKFSLKTTISAHDKKRVRCPKCASSQVAQSVQPFFVATAKKS